MKQNMGSLDRVIRVVVAALIAILYFTNIITGIVALILGIFAVIFILTSAVAVCPLYIPFKLSTKEEEKKV
jgi:hypothetical protein